MRDKKDLIGEPVDPAEEARYASEQGDGHPLIATIVGVLFILLGLAGGRRESFGPGAEGQTEMLFYLVTYAAMSTLIVWGIAYAVTIKKASTAWKVASLIVIMIVSIVAALAKVAGPSAALLEDAADINNQMRDAVTSGKEAKDMKFKAGKGPMSRMSAAALNPLLAESAAYQDEMKAAGLYQVVSFEGLTRQSPVLDHCERLDQLAALARLNGSRWPGHLAAAHAVGEQAVRTGEMPEAALQGFEKGARESGVKIERQWELNRLIATEAGAMCRILARRNWEKPRETVLFRSRSDLQAINLHAGKIEAYSAEAQRIKAESRAFIETRLTD